VLAERGLAPTHPLDLLTAFRADVTKRRYANWDELMHYCRYSAMPVGRFVLDVHGESASAWASNDALCAALQINNHLQDCGKDFRELNRVYVPLDALKEAGASVDELGLPKAPANLLRCLQGLAARNEKLLGDSRSFSGEVRDFRLGLEISVIQAFADGIVRLLKARDPLSERVHLGPLGLIGRSLRGIAGETLRRATGRRGVSSSTAGA
jgi:phytoene/squalene synthetase